MRRARAWRSRGRALAGAGVELRAGVGRRGGVGARGLVHITFAPLGIPEARTPFSFALRSGAKPIRQTSQTEAPLGAVRPMNGGVNPIAEVGEEGVTRAMTNLQRQVANAVGPLGGTCIISPHKVAFVRPFRLGMKRSKSRNLLKPISASAQLLILARTALTHSASEASGP